MKNTDRVTYIRRITFDDKQGKMSFLVGQNVGEKRSNGRVIEPAKFQIHNIVEAFANGNHIVDITVVPLKIREGQKKAAHAKWKRIVNASEVIEYNIDFLCEE